MLEPLPEDKFDLDIGQYLEANESDEDLQNEPDLLDYPIAENQQKTQFFQEVEVGAIDGDFLEGWLPVFDDTSSTNDTFSENSDVEVSGNDIFENEEFWSKRNGKIEYEMLFTDVRPVTSSRELDRQLTKKRKHLTMEHQNQKSQKIDNVSYPSRNSGFYGYIAPNTSNSCFIDATFEMLWNSILPDVAEKLYGLNSANNNEYDNALLDSFKLYITGVKEDTLAASNCIRKFVWGLPGAQFERGEMGDLVELIEHFFNNLSSHITDSICSFEGKSLIRSFTCSNDAEHCYVDVHSFMPIITLNCKTVVKATEAKTQNRFVSEELFSRDFEKHTILRRINARCREANGCTGSLECCNSIFDEDQYPPFLIISDTTNHQRQHSLFGEETAVDHPFFPKKIQLFSGFVEYIMQARIYSTDRNGVHFYTIWFKKINGVKCLVRIDNLRSSIVILTSDVNEAYDILQEYRNTVIVCYKKVQNKKV